MHKYALYGVIVPTTMVFTVVCFKEDQPHIEQVNETQQLQVPVYAVASSSAMSQSLSKTLLIDRPQLVRRT